VQDGLITIADVTILAIVMDAAIAVRWTSSGQIGTRRNYPQRTQRPMSERPIPFSVEMVRAILDGRKTMTRRVMRIQPPSDKHVLGRVMDTTGDRRQIDKLHWLIYEDYRVIDSDEKYFTCPYGEPSDRLWVRETWAENHPVLDNKYRYRANLMAPDLGKPWKSSRFMPRAASRITLEVTAVRVERLQDISEIDCEIEMGVHPYTLGNTAYTKFQELWNKINGKKHPWASNPWVWVIEFQIDKAA
jgi:hypothetical protein